MGKNKGKVTGEVTDTTYTPIAGPNLRLEENHPPLQVKVVFFSPPIVLAECTSLLANHPHGIIYVGSREPIAETQTNENGQFMIELDPGDYSTLIEHPLLEGRFYGSRICEDAHRTLHHPVYLEHVEVKDKETTTHDLTVHRIVY